jgi:uncharacterized protein (TIGR02596 family)
MSLRRKYPGSPASRNAFSLIEMLVTLAIVAILAALSIPAISSNIRAYQLSATSQTVINTLVLARQKALSGSHAVQVRFYLLPDYNSASPGTAPLVSYRAMQYFAEGDPTNNASGTVFVPLTALTKVIFFPSPVIVMANTTQSPLLSLSGQSGLPNDASNPLPTYGANYNYTYFRYKPDGTTDLTSGNNSVTLMLENDKIVANGLPKNYETLQIDPMIGSVLNFRP